ncbi:MAG: hypothetical protein WC043_00420 [Pseudobdellovibrionaceae bacterium]
MSCGGKLSIGFNIGREQYFTMSLIGMIFIVLIYFLGFGGAFLVFLCGAFGVHEFKISRGWKEEKQKRLGNGEPREKLREDIGLAKRSALYVYIPVTLYCAIIYVVYQLCDGNTYASEVFLSYLGTHHLLHQISEFLYPTILTHTSAIAVTQALRADTIQHIYSILFNLPILSVFVFLPSLPAWITQAYVFETRGFKRPFCAFGVILFSAGFTMLVVIGNLLWDAPLYLSTRRFSYDVLENENFWVWLIVLSYTFFLGFSYCLTLFIAYAMTYAKGSPPIFNSKDT